MKCFIGKAFTPGWLSVVTPYKKEYIEQFKIVVPSGQRKWEPDSKQWLVQEIYAVEVVELIKQHFPEAEITTDLVLETEDSLFEQLFALLPDEHIDRIYKLLATALHPDKGGSNETMSRLNQAYDRERRKRERDRLV